MMVSTSNIIELTKLYTSKPALLVYQLDLQSFLGVGFHEEDTQENPENAYVEEKVYKIIKQLCIAKLNIISAATVKKVGSSKH